MKRSQKRTTAKRQLETETSISKALAVLRAFIDGQNEWGVRELAAKMNQPPSTAHRLLSRLRAEGFLDFDESKQKYCVGFEMVRLAAAVDQRHEFKQIALPVMRELTDRCGESTWLSIYDSSRFSISQVAEQQSVYPLHYSAPLGREDSLIDSASGLAVLTALPKSERCAAIESLKQTGSSRIASAIREIEAAGFATSRTKGVESAMTIAAAVKDVEGRPIGSLALVVPIYRLKSGHELALGKLVVDFATRLSNRLRTRLLGGASTGSWHDAVALISQLLHRDAPQVTVTPAFGGGVRNLEDLARGEGIYALTTAASLFKACHSQRRRTPLRDRLHVVMNLSELHLFVISRKECAFQSMEELANLRISPGEQGFSAAQVLEDLLRLARVPRSQVERRGGGIFYFDYPEAARQFKEGSIDILMWFTSVSNPVVQEIYRTTRSQLQVLPEQLLRRLLATNPGYRLSEIASGTFPRWSKSTWSALTVPTVLVCSAHCRESDVYEVTRTIFQNRAELALMSSVYNRIEPQFAVANLTAPLHPGAARYFQEIGATPSYAACT